MIGSGAFFGLRRRPRRSRRGCKEAGPHAREAPRAGRIGPRLVPLGRQEACRHAREAVRVTKFGPSWRHRVPTECHVAVIWASSSAIWVPSTSPQPSTPPQRSTPPKPSTSVDYPKNENVEAVVFKRIHFSPPQPSASPQLCTPPQPSTPQQTCG